MEDAADRPQTPPPGRIENLLIAVPVVHDVLAQQQIQMMMAVLMDQIVDQIEVVAVETVDEGQSRPMPVAEAHNPLRLQGNNT